MELFCNDISQFLETRDEKELDHLLSATTESFEQTLADTPSTHPRELPSAILTTRESELRPPASTSHSLPKTSFTHFLQCTCARSTSHSLPFRSSSSSHCRCASPKTAAEVARARQTGIPSKTQQDTRYCVKIWKEWRIHRIHTTGVNISPRNQLSLSDLAHWLTHFILEVRKKNGEVYLPNSLHHICCGLMREVRQSGKPQLDLFKDPEFSDFRASLDAEMKRLQFRETE